MKMNIGKETIEALLDNDQRKLNAILATKIRALKAALGEKCPNCGSENCAADNDGGHCDDCEASWNHSDFGILVK